jgi:hypothetical protein
LSIIPATQEASLDKVSKSLSCKKTISQKEYAGITQVLQKKEGGGG